MRSSSRTQLEFRRRAVGSKDTSTQVLRWEEEHPHTHTMSPAIFLPQAPLDEVYALRRAHGGTCPRRLSRSRFLTKGTRSHLVKSLADICLGGVHQPNHLQEWPRRSNHCPHSRWQPQVTTRECIFDVAPACSESNFTCHCKWARTFEHQASTWTCIVGPGTAVCCVPRSHRRAWKRRHLSRLLENSLFSAASKNITEVALAKFGCALACVGCHDAELGDTGRELEGVHEHQQTFWSPP